VVTTNHSRPTSDDYYMKIAMAVRRRANCQGSKVGALLVLNDRIIATGYNGTPEGMKNCEEGGCSRCTNREKYESGTAYDICICVHAEQNTLLTVARFGNRVEGSVIYTTVQPCFTCSKSLLQAKIKAVYYCREWNPPTDLKADYDIIQARFPEGCKQVPIEDPDETWAYPARSVVRT
jgi:dCMP deaminase